MEHLVWGHVQHANLRSHNHQVVPGNVVSGRSQAIAVKHRSHPDAIGEGDGGRPVPGLHERAVIFVECLLLRAHALVVRPGFGDHHHDGVGQRTTGQHQKLQVIVKHGRVASVRIDDRKDGGQVVPKEGRLEHRLSGVHPVNVAPQRVDLAVVDQIPIGMSPIPAGEGIGAEARMDQGQRAFNGRVGQVRVECLQLLRSEHSLVYDGPMR